MATAANIVLADAAGTPVNHTFVPIGFDGNGVFWFEDQSQANAIGFWKISAEFKRPQQPKSGESSKDRSIRVRWGLHEPVLENVTNSTVSGVAPAPTIAYVPRSFTEYVMPERSALIDRQHLRKMTSNLNANSQLISMVENLIGLW